MFSSTFNSVIERHHVKFIVVSFGLFIDKKLLLIREGKRKINWRKKDDVKT
jgi:hypothetical protein